MLLILKTNSTRGEDIQHTAQSNVRKPQVASFHPPVHTAAKYAGETGSAHTKDSGLHM